MRHAAQKWKITRKEFCAKSCCLPVSNIAKMLNIFTLFHIRTIYVRWKNTQTHAIWNRVKVLSLTMEYKVHVSRSHTKERNREKEQKQADGAKVFDVYTFQCCVLSQAHIYRCLISHTRLGFIYSPVCATSIP